MLRFRVSGVWLLLWFRVKFLDLRACWGLGLGLGACRS